MERKSYATICFYNGIYWGAATTPGEINSAFLLTLSHRLQPALSLNFTCNTGVDEYIWYAAPSSYGTPLFNVGGFDGGFSKITTFNFTNSSGYSDNYDVWRSDNANLGSTVVKVTTK